MKTKNLILIMLSFTVFLFTGVPARGQNKSRTETTKGDTVIYTCTMHPEILSNPGTCPKCGMQLVEKSEASEKQHEKHNMENNNSSDKNKITNASTHKDSVLYTCSMHFEIQSNQPATCPKCGMTLIKKSTTSIKEERDHKMPSMGMGVGIMAIAMLVFMIVR